MSDSGRQIGDCKHGGLPEFCIMCLQAECERLRVDALAICNTGIQSEDEVFRIKTDLAALRKSHADAVEAAVREIVQSSGPDFVLITVKDAIKIIKRHLGPAKAGEKGQ